MSSWSFRYVRNGCLSSSSDRISSLPFCVPLLLQRLFLLAQRGLIIVVAVCCLGFLFQKYFKRLEHDTARLCLCFSFFRIVVVVVATLRRTHWWRRSVYTIDSIVDLALVRRRCIVHLTLTTLPSFFNDIYNYTFMYVYVM